MCKWFDKTFCGDSPSARWGVFTILVSFNLFLLPLSVSFWAVYISLEGGEIVFPSSLISVLFLSLAILGFIAFIALTIFTISMARYWRKISSEYNDPLRKDIQSLIKEIRRDRNEQTSSQ